MRNDAWSLDALASPARAYRATGLALWLAAAMMAPVASAVSPESAADDRPAWRFGALYTGEYLHNVRGGLERGGAYLDNLDLTLEMDGEKAFGVPGLTAMLYGLYNNGGSISGRYVGDTHAISNIEAPRAVRLYELWVDWKFGAINGRSLRLGLYDLNSEFDASEVASLFLNGTHGIGIDFSQAGRNGPSIFPVTSLAARLQWPLVDGWLLRGAVLDGVPGDPARPEATVVKLANGDGELYVAELERSSESLRFVIGHWRFTTQLEDLLQVDSSGDSLRRDDSHGSYAFVEGELWRAAAGGRRLRGVARIGVASPQVNPVPRSLRLGLVLDSPLVESGGDQLGLAVATHRNGDPFLRGATANGTTLRRGETNVEFTWRLPVNDWLTLQPNLQWVVDPGSDPALGDAWVIGLRFEVGGVSH